MDSENCCGNCFTECIQCGGTKDDFVLLSGENDKWDELFLCASEISLYFQNGYEIFAVSFLEDYVQKRIAELNK
jgi:hypothetical protein